MDNRSLLADRCKQNFGSASVVKEEAKMSFNLILQIFS